MKRTIKSIGLATVASALALSFVGNPFASATVPGNNTRVSVSGSGAQSSKESFSSSISRDGKYVVFVNQEDNLAGTDSGNDYDVFVRDVQGNTTTRVSVSTSGVQANGNSTTAVISETGRYVVFGSSASNLIDGRTISAVNQMYVRDTATNTTSILSEVSSGVFANATVSPMDVSTDGRFVLFMSQATNLGPSVGSGYYNIFLLDRSTNSITWVNEPAAGSGYTGSNPYNASMSCDGSFIVLDGNASYFGLSYSPHLDVLLVDMRGGKKVTNLTGIANGAAVKPEISCNGNYVGFASYANNLDPLTAGLSINYHAFIYDRISNTFDLLDQNSSGVRANAYMMNTLFNPFYLSLSDRGTAIFRSDATNLATGATGSQLYLRDPKTGTTELLTRNSGVTQADSDSLYPVISLDGRVVSYESYATNLVSGDTNSQRDVFVSETGL
jgi:hypothetical protein